MAGGMLSAKKDVVYGIPFTCGKEYVGQTGRCLNVRLREHESSLKGAQYSHLAMVCKECTCQRKLCDTEIIDKHKKRTTREIIQAFRINKGGDKGVSQASLLLTDSEFAFLDVT